MRAGGILVCTVGAEEAWSSASLLQKFGLQVPSSPVPTTGSWREPEPMGHLRSLFLDARNYGAGDYRCGVTFDAAWPIVSKDRGTDILVRGHDECAAVVARAVGRGTVVLIGDSRFALNKNLEYVGGQPFEYGHENAHFWRWLISRITGQTEWIPPAPESSSDQGVGPEGAEGRHPNA